ncbi:MAG: hypothetical protein LBC42_02530 [Puniceicoccales bacterium]|jgi:type III secretion protein C|nr:hypothetical protein [Puniceicoccales bacterium]
MKCFILSLAALCLSATPFAARAGEIPWADAAYYHYAQDQSLDALIRDFTAIQGIDVVIPQVISGTVNGIFENLPPSEFWDNIARAYGLAWFYDGNALYVYPSAAITTRVVPMSSQESTELKGILNELDVIGPNNVVRYMPSTKMMVFSGTPRFMEVVQSFLEKVQRNTIQNFTDETVVQVFPLKYAFAYDVKMDVGADASVLIEGVATILQRIINGINTLPPPVQDSVTLGSVSNSDSVEGVLEKKVADAAERSAKLAAMHDARTAREDAKKPINFSADKVKTASLVSTSDNLLPGKTPVTVQEESPKTSYITSITYDARLNAVIIRDRRELMPFYQALIERFDIPTNAVEIRVAIVDVDVGSSHTMGLNVVQFLNDKNTFTWRPLAGSSNAFENEDSNFAATLTGLLGFGYNIGARLQALEEANIVKTFSRPSVLTLDNLAAVISQSDQAYIPVAGSEAVDLFSVSATISLRVIPHIINEEDEGGNAKRRIKLFVNITDGLLDVSGAKPKVSSSQINTQTILEEGQSLVVGGYYKERHAKLRHGIPLFCKLPVVGRLFCMSTDNVGTIERLFIISPRILEVNAQDGDPYEQFFRQADLSGRPTMGINEFTIPKKSVKRPSAHRPTMGQ